MAHRASPATTTRRRLKCRIAVTLGIMTAALSTSCLVSSGPPLEGEEVVPPRIVILDVAPSPFSIVQTTSDTSIDPTNFSVSFWSEDLDLGAEAIQGFLYLNYSHSRSPTVIGAAPLAGGSLSDAEPRIMKIPWDENRSRPAGCYIFTMIIGQQSDFSLSSQLPKEEARDRVTFVTWVVAHDTPPYELTLEECPQLGQNQGLN